MTAIHITVINYCPRKTSGQLPHKSTRVQLGNLDTIFFFFGGGGMRLYLKGLRGTLPSK